MWGSGELPGETVSDAGLRGLSTQMPIAGVEAMAQGRSPGASGHPEQRPCCERQYKEEGQLSFTRKRKPETCRRRGKPGITGTGANPGKGEQRRGVLSRDREPRELGLCGVGGEEKRDGFQKCKTSFSMLEVTTAISKRH